MSTADVRIEPPEVDSMQADAAEDVTLISRWTSLDARSELRTSSGLVSGTSSDGCVWPVAIGTVPDIRFQVFPHSERSYADSLKIVG